MAWFLLFQYFSGQRVKCAADAVRLSNGEFLQLLRIISEPIATAVAVYNLSKGNMDKTILVYDLGSATYYETKMAW